MKLNRGCLAVGANSLRLGRLYHNNNLVCLRNNFRQFKRNRVSKEKFHLLFYNGFTFISPKARQSQFYGTISDLTQRGRTRPVLRPHGTGQPHDQDSRKESIGRRGSRHQRTDPVARQLAERDAGRHHNSALDALTYPTVTDQGQRNVVIIVSPHLLTEIVREESRERLIAI